MTSVSYFRRQLKIRGASKQTARHGIFDMEFDCSVEELKSKIETMIAKAPYKYNVTRHESGAIEVEMKEAYCTSMYYNTLVFAKGDWLYVRG